MAFDPLTAVVSLVETGIDKFLPDKMSEVEKATLKADMTKFVASESTKKDSAFRNFILAYEGSAKDAGKFITFVRGMIRPVLTVSISGTYMYGWTKPLTFSPEQMAVLQPALLLVLFFWFGDKALQKSGLLDVLKKK